MTNGQTAQRTAAEQTVHQLKITLQASQPPIWRRLEVPSDLTLDRLHEVIQDAFGWFDYHMWVFETPEGEYGMEDPELGHRNAISKKVEAAAPQVGGRIRYVYDFGDGWEHDIEVENVLAAEPGIAYPRCLTGERACPPEDCGGIGGYEELLQILADPEHDERAERLEWLGMDSADEFDPAAFDVGEVNEVLSDRAKVLVNS